MNALPPHLIDEIAERLQDPRLRHGAQHGTFAGTVTDPAQVDGLLNEGNPLASAAWQGVIQQMKAWGQAMPPMHVMKGEGFTSASTERPDTLPLAPPATAAELAEVERAAGRDLPRDLRQALELANGGWGPGIAYTPQHGTGLLGTRGIAATLEDMRRRGPDYTGEIAWPDSYLPIGETTGTVAYDLDSGAIRVFDEYFRDRELTAEQAWSTLQPSLADWLDSWLAS